MDLAEALDLATRGRAQAPVDLGDAVEPAEPRRRRRSERSDEQPPVRTPAQPADFRLSQAEWYGHVENVARELAELSGMPHWYDLRERERERMREQAARSLVAVSRANVRLRQRRIADRLDPVPSR